MTVIKPVVNSWDVFDTLLTRFVLDPLQVFALVEQRQPGHDFVKRRLDAQAVLDKCGAPYVIHDIYRQIAATGLDPDLARLLLREELALERSLMLPIAAAVARLRADDLLISDMYLPGEIISALLAEICGLDTALPVIRSNWGKANGTIWPKLLERYVIRCHYGDNPHSDAAVPDKFGIRTVLLRDAEPSPWEKTVLQLNLPHLALILREVRLRSLPPEADLYLRLACGPYLALLLGYSAHLADQFGPTADFRFLSRDGDDLGRIFRLLFPAIRSSNIDLSRRLANSTALDPQFSEQLTAACVLVDGVSTGRSAGGLLARIGRPEHRLCCLLFLDHLLGGERAAASPMTGMFNASEFGNRHFPLELLLQSPYPPVIGLALDPASGGVVRSFAPPELSAPEARSVRLKTRIVTEFLNTIGRRGLPLPSPNQAQALMRAALEPILASDLQPEDFPTFLARERFAPF